ncbi:hypothetical protein WUBG_12684 [Wuchereria bancrofti]|uniref:Uncharacterized protein n=1 Tax=Wuchereria bancrofti TaxID=6293 RepID=J9E2N0_WUCBA|nr:hypothetical protein WUBG_12684 [Wuchereria bancrofti]
MSHPLIILQSATDAQRVTCTLLRKIHVYGCFPPGIGYEKSVRKTASKSIYAREEKQKGKGASMSLLLYVYKRNEHGDFSCFARFTGTAAVSQTIYDFTMIRSGTR